VNSDKSDGNSIAGMFVFYILRVHSPFLFDFIFSNF